MISQLPPIFSPKNVKHGFRRDESTLSQHPCPLLRAAQSGAVRLTEPSGVAVTAAGRLLVSERASGVWHLLAPDGGRVRSGFRPHQRLLEEGVGREACEGGEGGQE